MSMPIGNAKASQDAYSEDATSGLFSTSFTDGTNVPTTGGTSSPASGDSLFFGTETTGTTTPSNDLTGATYDGLTFLAGASTFTIGGNSFTLAGNISNASAATQTINAPIITSGTDAFTLTGTGVTLGGGLSGSGTVNQTGVASGVTGLTLGADDSGFTGIFTADNSSSTRTAFTIAAAGSAGAAWTFNRSIGGGVALNFGTGTINFGALSGGGWIRNNVTGTTSVISVGALGTNTTFSGLLQGNGSDLIALSKVGTGAFELTGANTYTGSTSVLNGTLVIGNGGSISASSGVTLGDPTANTNGVLQLGDATAAANATILGLATAGTGTGNAVVGGNSAISTLTLTNAAAVTFGGVFGGVGTNQNNLALTKTSTMALTLTGTSTNTGATQATGGTLALSGTGALSGSVITIGAVGGGATNTNFNILPSTTSGTVTRGAGLSFNGDIGTGNAYANLTDTGVAANTDDVFTGALNLNSGETRINLSSVAGGNAALTFGSLTRNPGTTLIVANGAGTASIASLTSNSTNIVFSTAPTLVGGGGAIGTSTTSILPYATVNTALATYTAANGLQALTTFGALTDGTTTANNVSNTNSAATYTINTGATINSLTLGGSPTAVVVNGTGVLTITSGAINLTQSNTFNVANLAFGSAEGFIFVQNTRTPIINSVITGSGGLTVVFNDLNATSAGLTLNGANTYTGVTTFSGNNSGMSAKLANSLALQNTTLDYNNYGGSLVFGPATAGTSAPTTYTFGGLKGSQNINLNNNNTTVGAVALTIGSAGDVDTSSTINTYSGVLSNTVAGGSIIKAGASTEVFSAANTYSGGTTISAGKLQLTNTAGSGTGSGAVALSGGTSATLSGTGISTGGTTVTNGSRIAPGNNTVDADGSSRFNFGNAGALTLTGGLNLTSANLDLDLTSAHSGNDSIVATGGALTLTSVVVNINELSSSGATTLDTSAPYILISGASSVNGGTSALSNISGITTNFIGSERYTAVYNSVGTDLEVQFSNAAPAPEPGSLSIVALGGLGLLRRRRARLSSKV